MARTKTNAPASGNGYTKPLLSFLGFIILTYRSHMVFFRINTARHFALNQDKHVFPIYHFVA